MAGRFFDPKLTAGNVLTILAVLLGIASTWYQLGERVTVTEHALANQRVGIERIDRDLSDVEDRAGDVRERLKGIEVIQQQQNETLKRILRAVEAK
jgi:hypothetical protein